MAAPLQAGRSDPVIRRIATTDVVEALAAGLRDFSRAPRPGMMLGLLTAACGIAIVVSLSWAGMPYFAYPIAAGFALICPFIATYLYEVSRRLEAGLPLESKAIWRTISSRSEIRWLGFMTLFVLIVWMYQVRLLLAIFLGFSGISATLPEFLHMVLTTRDGLIFLALGNVIGAVLATVLFSLSVVSFPLVLDRDVDMVTAMVTSIRAVAANPIAMLLWGGDHRRAADPLDDPCVPRLGGDAAPDRARNVAPVPPRDRAARVRSGVPGAA